MLVPLSMWILATSFSQSPAPVAADGGWLKAVPANIDVAVRIRSVDATHADLMAMLSIMSPKLADRAEQGLTDPLAQFRQKFGEAAARTPWVGLIRTAAPSGEGKPPFAILVLNDDYPGVLKAMEGGKDPELKHQEGGYDAFKTPNREAGYAGKGPGFVAFGPDQALIAAIARPGEKTFDKALTPAPTKQFLAGDVGVYVSASTLVARYSEQTDQARQTFMAALDQAGQQAGNAGTMNAAKEVYGALFNSLKNVAALTISVDVASEGLSLAGVLTVKPDTALAKASAQAASGTPADLAGLPSEASLYAYLNMDATTFGWLQDMRMMNPFGKPTPDQAKALALFGELGRVETIGSLTYSGGVRGMNVTHVADPKKYIAACQANIQALKEGDGPSGVYKDLKIESNVENYRGLTFSHIIATLDFEKFVQLNPNNPAAAAAMKSMFGGETMNTWLGTDGQRVFRVTAPTWNDVKAQIDTFLKGNAGIGTVAGFKSVRSRLPEQANLVVLVSAQGLVRLFASQFAATLNKPDLKAPGDLPKEPVLFGVPLTPRSPFGYEFHLVVPSQVGPIFKKGLVPLFQSITPPSKP
ncbi:MAG TPA: hypothetical protein VKF17_07490 [Isosphaeraceae bacterium]|nr:hypothetical protein [Isosphaeraceae bacterium]